MQPPAAAARTEQLPSRPLCCLLRRLPDSSSSSCCRVSSTIYNSSRHSREPRSSRAYSSSSSTALRSSARWVAPQQVLAPCHSPSRTYPRSSCSSTALAQHLPCHTANRLHHTTLQAGRLHRRVPLSSLSAAAADTTISTVHRQARRARRTWVTARATARSSCRRPIVHTPLPQTAVAVAVAALPLRLAASWGARALCS